MLKFGNIKNTITVVKNIFQELLTTNSSCSIDPAGWEICTLLEI
jgi:hypothetical protein